MNAPAQARFITTRWSLVLRAAHDDSPEARAALEELCRAYWYPLYAYLRCSGRGPEDAADFTQSFFARLLGKVYLRAADPRRGRFRTFLLTALKHFAASEWAKTQTQKTRRRPEVDRSRRLGCRGTLPFGTRYPGHTR